MKPLLVSTLLVCVFLGGCQKDIQNEEAVRRGIMNYLSKRPDLTAMDVTVTKVAFRQSEADATVHFQAKNSSAPGTGLDMNYLLERKGNDWVVKSKGMSGHGASGTGDNPHSMAPPAMGTMPGTLPPGHPPMQPKSTEPK